ncbi:MAG: nucleoside triphosphate pyrophosphohydrolase [Chloroflexota bacterium]
MSPGITIVGLGPGDPALLTRAAWQVLDSADEVWLRTGRHPVVEALPRQLRLHTFDALYDAAESYSAVYDAIVEQILSLGDRPQGVIYAVPGDPMVGEATVEALRARTSLPLTILHGVSFVEPCLALVGHDALDGLFVADALALAGRHHPPFPPDTPALVGQLHSTWVAADVKLTLMNQYPDEHRVTLIHAGGTVQAWTETVPLYQIDRATEIGPLTALFVPALEAASAFETFQETVAHLRAPDGCPWDRQQTPQSLRQHLMEEAYEALQALDREDMEALREELGDLLLQVVLQAQIATEHGNFRMADVIAAIQDKIIRRHPHVFGDLKVEGVDQVLHNWERLKASERDTDSEGKGLLDGVPLVLPALAQAAEIQGRVARVGFDWPAIEGVVAKVIEELEEVRQATGEEARAAEVGDLLFAVVNYARWLKVDPEAALREANARFRQRFAQLEQAAQAQGRNLAELGAQELDHLWEWAKRGQGGL